MRLAIIADKPSLLHAFAPLLPEFFPDVDLAMPPVMFLMVGWYSGDHRFSLPRGLRWKDYPFVEEPVYNRIGFSECYSRVGVTGKLRQTPATADAEMARLFAEADEILLLVDGSPEGIHPATIVLEQIFGEIPSGRCTYPWVNDLSEGSLRKALAARRPYEEFALPEVTAGRIRRFFDFNYIVNSAGILGDAMRVAGLDAPNLSKFMLQTLYHCRAIGAVSEDRLIGQMVEWRGSGRYAGADTRGLGSAASRSQIVEVLVRNGFLDRTDHRPRTLTVSAAGSRFLDLLHPGCEDVDLPYRIAEWAALSEDEAKARIGRYMRTFFGRQKFHLPRKLAASGARPAS